MQIQSQIVTASLAGQTEGALGTDNAQQVPFAGLLKDAVGKMQQLEDHASQAVEGLLDGSGTDVHTAMIAVSNADAAFELALAVRNKGMAAFEQLMNMQF
ncbi:MAG: flagellar hook-basal body complex protein FliE [Acidobacterium ailaaui]|nr:flagellar hook-basal body complex protein FliE [Pseudacidobacterium ailaaui]MCL6464423.1 flagellar hook-basal body complex protein FliE [Pseudacidobacterium ailaaui]